MTKQLVVVLFFFQVATVLCATPPPLSCQAVTTDTKRLLLDYVSRKYHISAQAVEVLPDQVLENTCYSKVVIQSDQSSPITLYVSPDRSFVFPEVYLLNIDPVSQDITRRSEVNKELSADTLASVGRPDALATIVIFSDFQCPYCRLEAERLQALLALPNPRARIIFRHYPLQMHDWALKASESAACIAEQRKDAFWLFHDQLFANQRSIGAATFRKFLDSFIFQEHLSTVAIDECMRSGRASAIVKADVAMGHRFGVNSTPTIFLNGFKREGVQNEEELNTLITESIDRKTQLEQTQHPRLK